MAQFAGRAQRLDPYKNFKLRLWDGNRTYFGSKLTGLLPPPEIVQHRAGGDPSTAFKSPGRNEYEDITLERGITQDQSFGAWASQASGQNKYPAVPASRGFIIQDESFSNWASQVWDYGSSLGAEVSLANFRKNLYLEFYDEAGQLVVSYRINSQGVSELPARPAGGAALHLLHPCGPGTLQEQLALIFENSLRKLWP